MGYLQITHPHLNHTIETDYEKVTKEKIRLL